MGSEQILINLYENNILKIANIIDYCFRWLGWTIIKILASIVNSIEVAVNKIYTLNDFFSSDLVNNFIDKYKPLIWAILAISIIILGYRILFNKNKNREHLPSNIIFSVLIIVLLPTFMIKLNEITQLGIEDVKGYTTSANELIKNNLFDMHFLDKNRFNLDSEKNNIKEDKILTIDINEKVDDSKISTKNIFDKKVTMNDNGNLEIINLEKGWFKLDEEYYRYNIDFILIIISLGATGITLLCVALKVARLLFELAFNKLFATLFAFADIDDGKKIREIFKNILSIFAVLFATAIMVKLYVIFTVWIGSKMGNIEVGLGFSAENLAKIIVQIGASIAVIDGPNIIERILGIDAGLRGGFGTVMSAYGVAKGLGLSRKTISSGSNLLAKTAGKSATMGAGILGGIMGLGLEKGNSSLSEDQNKIKTNSNTKDNNLQSEMNGYKTTNSSNMDNKSTMKENSNTENQQDNNKLNNSKNNLTNKNVNEVEPLKYENNTPNTLQNEINNKDLNNINGNKDISLKDEMDGKSTAQVSKNKNSLNNSNAYKNNNLEDQMKNQGSNTFRFDDNENNQRQLNSEIGKDHNGSLNNINGYKNNSLFDEMNSKSIDGNINKLNHSNYENNKANALPKEIIPNDKKLSNSSNLYNNNLAEDFKTQGKSNLELSSNNQNSNSLNDVNGSSDTCNNNFATIDINASRNKINSQEEMLQNGTLPKHNDLPLKDNNRKSEIDNEYNVGNILNNYIKGKINSNSQITSMKRSYNLGKNITSKWDVPKKINNYKNKKGKEKNAI